MKKLLAIVLILLFSQSAALSKETKPGKTAKTHQGKVKLVFQRESRFVSGLISARVKSGDQEIASVSNGSTEIAWVKPGKHKLVVDYWLSLGESTFTFSAKPGKTYRFEIAARQVNIYPGPSVAPVASTTDKKGNISAGYFGIRLLGNK